MRQFEKENSPKFKNDLKWQQSNRATEQQLKAKLIQGVQSALEAHLVDKMNTEIKNVE